MVKYLGIGMVCAAALLAGCKEKTPEGQVAATVNGKEVTLQEINAEIGAANMPPNVDKKEAQRAMLQRVIERKLLVAAAEDEGIDKTADYLMGKRRAEEMMAAQAYAKKQLAAVPVPTEADITKFMADHGNVFTQREQLSIDQIRFPPPKDIKSLRVLEGDHTMDAVAAHLTQMGIKFQRAPTGLDSGQVPTQLMKMIDTAPPGEPFVVPDRGMVTVNVVTGRRPVAVDPQQAKSGAVSAWRQQKFEELIAQQVNTLKSKAKITYQSGFAPPPAGKTTSPAVPASGAPAPAAPTTATPASSSSAAPTGG